MNYNGENVWKLFVECECENCFVVWDGDIIYLFYRLDCFLFNEIINIVGMIDMFIIFCIYLFFMKCFIN